MTGGALILQGDALHLPLPNALVDLVVTSPPYLWKRKYAIEGAGELGNERTWREYLDNLYTVTDEMLRVLKPSGSIWVNLGDTRVAGREPKWLGIPPKSRLLLPERYRVGCQDRYAAAGVIVRQVQLWEKANGLPESVTDRTRDTHEDWVHIVKRSSYYAALDELRQPHAAKTLTHRGGGQSWGNDGNPDNNWAGNGQAREVNPLGTLPGSVWRIASEPLHLPKWLGVDHYAAFASEWPRRLILGFSPPGICLECGQGRVPVVDRGGIDPELLARRGGHADRSYSLANHHGGDPAKRGIGLNVSGKERLEHSTPTTILGYACPCASFNQPQPLTRPAVVLDPFSGTGTTVMVARALGRFGVGVDLSYDYCRAARWRVRHDGAKAISRTNLERQGSLL